MPSELDSLICWHIMRRTTIKIPDDLDMLLRHEAKRRGVTISDLTREAIQMLLDRGAKRQLLAAGAGRSGQPDISERIEEILQQEALPSRS
jgi:predicted transcriptional regulator